MKALKKLFKPAWKHKPFDPESVISKQNNSTNQTVDEYDTALVEIELRDR